MVKLRARAFVLLSSTLVFCCAMSCSSVKPRVVAEQSPVPEPAPMLDHPMTFAMSASPTAVRKLWTQQVPGLMTDLAVSRDGSAILLATVPNPEAGEGPRETGHGLTRFNRNGKKLWHIELEGTVKSLAMSDDGKLALVSSYDNTISAIDARGKIVWTVEGICKPVPIGKRFLCYHDDDAEANVAFDVYSDKGQKVLFYPITRDVLALKVSDDQRNTAVALEGGQVILFGPDFRSLWQQSVTGEVIDLAVSSGDHPRVAALYNVRVGAKESAIQGISVIGVEGKRLGDTVPLSRVEQIEMVPDGAGFAVYGNGVRGQYVAYYDLPPQRALAANTGLTALPEKWHRGDARAADFSSNVIVTRDLVILGYEDITESARHSHLIAFDFDGGVKWNIPLVTEEGAYLYAHGFAPIPSLISVGTDDGYLSAFQLKAKASAL